MRPDATDLLRGIARFLGEDVRPALTDRRLSFRALVAAHLATTLAAELEGEDVREAAAIERLAPLVGEEPLVPSDRAARRARLEQLQRALADGLRADRFDAAERAAMIAELRAVLADRLRVVSPRFDLSDRIE